MSGKIKCKYCKSKEYISFTLKTVIPLITTRYSLYKIQNICDVSPRNIICQYCKGHKNIYSTVKNVRPFITYSRFAEQNSKYF